MNEVHSFGFIKINYEMKDYQLWFIEIVLFIEEF